MNFATVDAEATIQTQNQQPMINDQQQNQAVPEFAEEMKRLREIVHNEYECKVRNAFEEIEELKNTLEESAKEKQAKNDRMLARQLDDKDGEIDELN